VFDLTKLDWLNGTYIRKFSPEDLAERLVAGPLAGRSVDRALLARIVPLVQERMNVLSDFDAMADFFFTDDIVVDAATFAHVKKKTAAEIASLLEAARAVCAEGAFEAKSLDERLRALASQQGAKTGDLFMALRIAVTGKTATPPLLESMEILGRDKSLARISRAIDALRAG
jgi:glutamyl-tRNA synthetase